MRMDSTKKIYRATLRLDLTKQRHQEAFKKMSYRDGRSISEYLIDVILAYQNPAESPQIPYDLEFIRSLIKEEIKNIELPGQAIEMEEAAMIGETQDLQKGHTEKNLPIEPGAKEEPEIGRDEEELAFEKEVGEFLASLEGEF